MIGPVLVLFPGLDFLGRAFEDAGFCVVRGPDVIWGGDIRRFHPTRGIFAGVIGGPPCQPFSPLVHMVRHNGYKPKHSNLIPEFERCVAEADPEWFVMEESPFAPLPSVSGYIVHDQILNNRWLGSPQRRVRRISFGSRDGRRLVIQPAALETVEYWNAVTSKGTPKYVTNKDGSRVAKKPRNGQIKQVSLSIGEMLRRQGFPPTMLDECPFTSAGKRTAIGNAVPYEMGRAIASAVARRIDLATAK